MNRRNKITNVQYNTVHIHIFWQPQQLQIPNKDVYFMYEFKLPKLVSEKGKTEQLQHSLSIECSE